MCFNPDIEPRSQVLPSILSLALQKSGKSIYGTFFHVCDVRLKDGKKDGRKGLTVHDRT